MRLRHCGIASNSPAQGCCSSEVEHSLGKGEVESSILSSSTIRRSEQGDVRGRLFRSHNPFGGGLGRGDKVQFDIA